MVFGVFNARRFCLTNDLLFLAPSTRRVRYICRNVYLKTNREGRRHEKFVF